MSDDSTLTKKDNPNNLEPSDPFHYEAPGISSLNAEQVIQGGCTPAPTCGNGGNGTSTAAAAVAASGIV